MQPAFIEQMSNLDIIEDPKDSEEMEEIDPNVITAVEELKQTITIFKKKLFYEYVSNDKKHDASSIDSMIFFHALFLQCIGYWISLLDTKSISKPTFNSKTQIRDFNSLSNAINTTQESSSDAKILVYNILFQFSIQHPFDLGSKKSDDIIG